MDDNFVWCALIIAMAYIFRDTVPSYRDLTDRYDRSRLDSINDAVDDNEQTMLAMGRKLGEMESDVAGLLTRLDDIHGRAIVEVRAVNYANSTNTVYRHTMQIRVDGGEWADIPVETAWGTDEEATMYIVNKPEEKTDD
jgi:hypothetical protein